MNSKISRLKGRIKYLKAHRKLMPDYPLGTLKDAMYLSFKSSNLWFKDVGKVIGLHEKDNQLLQNQKWLEQKMDKRFQFHHSEANKFVRFIHQGQTNGSIDLPYSKLKKRLVRVEYT